MAAGFGNKDFYRLDGAVFFVEQAPWHSTAGVAAYNQQDKDKARRLLKEAGYSGQPVRWITTREYEWMYKNALVAKQQLEAAGFVIDAALGFFLGDGGAQHGDRRPRWQSRAASGFNLPLRPGPQVTSQQATLQQLTPQAAATDLR